MRNRRMRNHGGQIQYTVSEADSNVGSVDGACVNSIIERQFDSGANGGVVTHVVNVAFRDAGSVVNSEGRRLTCVRVRSAPSFREAFWYA